MEPKGKPDQSPEEQPKPNYYPGKPPAEQPEPIKWAGKKPTPEQIKQILEDHAYWLLDNMKVGGVKDGAADRPHDLRKAELDKTDLREANLWGADLREADLTWADLREAVLFEADLHKANLTWADLHKAGLTEADLCGASLQGARLDSAEVTGARTDRHTKFLGVRGVDSTYGSAKFRDMAKHNEYLEEMRQTKRGKFLYRAWAIMADCGRTPWAWMGWCVVLAVGFALVFRFGLGVEAFNIPSALDKDFWTMLYYSTVTFTTLGFGDVTPETTAATWWVMGEVIAGYIMLGGLISIFATKLVARRG